MGLLKKIGRKVPFDKRLGIIDFFQGLKLGTLGIQRKLRRHLDDQFREWPKEKQYARGYYYQGLEELGITGAKPTGYRFAQYQVDDLLDDADVLDVGSNAGFVAIYCAKRCRSVTAVELNPFMNRIAKDAAAYLKRDNTSFIEADFATYETDRKFDVILSLSNHHTIDGNLNMGFERYMAKLANMLNPDGYLLFESHNVFGEGAGGYGDDGDMDEKFAIMNKRFDILRYRMVHCFKKHGVVDIDKLFIVCRKAEAPKPVDFDLGKARTKYEWQTPA